MTLKEWKLQPNMWMQMPFRSNIGFHKWYLGETGGVGDFFILVFSFTFDLIVSLAKEKVE